MVASAYNMTRGVILLALALLTAPAFTLKLQPNRIAKLQQHATAEVTAEGTAAAPTVSRREALHTFGGAVAAAAVAAAAATGAAPAARADVTRQSLKKSYFRYVPRIKEGMSWYAGELKELVDKEDFNTILAKYFIKTKTAKDDSLRPALYQSTSNKVERELIAPMKIWATTFAEKGTNPKVRAMLEQVRVLEGAMSSLEGVARTALIDDTAQVGRSRGRGIQTISTTENVHASYDTGVAAIKEYLAVANKGLTREVNQVSSPFDAEVAKT